MEQSLTSTKHIEKYVELSRKQSIISRQMIALNKIEEFWNDPEFDLEYSRVLHEKKFVEVMKDIVNHKFILKSVSLFNNKAIKGINHE